MNKKCYEPPLLGWEICTDVDVLTGSAGDDNIFDYDDLVSGGAL